MRIGRVYYLRFPNGKGYVGLTLCTMAKRLARAWRKYGEPACVQLGEFPETQLPAIEIAMIAALGTLHPGGYNKSPGGALVSAETAAKRVATRRAGAGYGLKGDALESMRAKLKARGNGRLGFKYSAESRAKMSASQKAYAQTEAGRERYGKGRKRGTVRSGI